MSFHYKKIPGVATWCELIKHRKVMQYFYPLFSKDVFTLTILP